MTLFCTIPFVNIQDGKPLEESPRWKFIEEEDNYTLLIYEVQPEDAGHYDCVALNTVGKATCTAKLNVESKSTFITGEGFNSISNTSSTWKVSQHLSQGRGLILYPTQAQCGKKVNTNQILII